jgi:hypothetical protein
VSLTNVPSPFSDNPAATSIGNIVIATAVPTSGADSSSSGGLPLGAKVGIGLGALVGFIIIVACITISITRRRRKLKQQQQLDRWTGVQPGIPPPHSPAWPAPTFAPYADTSPVQKEESPITPLEQIFYPKGVTHVRETEMEMSEQKSPPQAQYIWPEQQRRLKLQTEEWQRKPERKESYSTFPSADGNEISPKSFT